MTTNRHSLIRVCSGGWVALLALASGCSSPTPGVTTAQVSPAGGTVTVSEGALRGVSMQVPPNAVSEPVMLSIRAGGDVGTLPMGLRAVGPVVAISPANLTFASPVTITVPTTSMGSVLLTRPDAMSEWTRIEGATYDGGAGAMVGAVSRLGEFVGADEEAPVPDGGSGPSCSYPAGPYGSDEGRLFRPFSLENCDGSGLYNFHNQEFCDGRLTVLVVAAGWCRPCQIEAPQIQSEITEVYGSRGVRVVVAMSQNADYSPPSIAFCNVWRERYGLTNPMVIDPMGVTQIYFPNMAYPANMIIDRQGRIRYRTYGTSQGLTDMVNAIESLLAESP